MNWLFELTRDNWGDVFQFAIILCLIFRGYCWRRRYRKLTEKIANNVARMERNG